MSSYINSCSHANELIDVRGGCIVCQECGLVIAEYYENTYCVNKEINELDGKCSNYIYEVIERLNLPSSIFSYILQKINEKKDGKKITETLMAHCIYITLCELGIPFSLNDISGVTGINQSKISKEKKKESSSNIVIINTEDILERACSKLHLNYKQYTLIKESMIKINNGFNPSTIIAANINVFCKKNNLDISIKQISSVVGVSCMSIKRYMKKNDISSGSEISKR
jgi:transcription initiation factor TFIIIB Brf1 subunit/transcription initiation factor TFIIB